MGHFVDRLISIFALLQWVAILTVKFDWSKVLFQIIVHQTLNVSQVAATLSHHTAVVVSGQLFRTQTVKNMFLNILFFQNKIFPQICREEHCCLNNKTFENVCIGSPNA